MNNTNKIYINDRAINFTTNPAHDKPKFIIIPKSKVEEILSFIRESPERDDYKIIARVYESKTDILGGDIALTDQVVTEGLTIDLALIN